MTFGLLSKELCQRFKPSGSSLFLNQDITKQETNLRTCKIGLFILWNCILWAYIFG